VPHCYGSGFDAVTGRFVLILEDLAAGPCEFPDTLHPIDADRASNSTTSAARLHATFWGRLPTDNAGPLAWLYTASADSASLLTAPLLKTSS
ncbi:phosphotransferase, partial [Mycobacterium sp. ITM-2017-0098]